ncbi:MAG: polysaccharide biosynthesis C-terminal domain-containing protein [Cyclobacteriaceae bacterium]|nr:polysaccharide biosynthesis C-terminal domain-containing protein [Cyclobacteriaceae bacterium]
MGLIGRQSIKSTIYIYLGVGAGFILRAKLFPQHLSESEIGILALLISYGSIFAQIAILGFNHATIKYFPFFRNPKQGHHGFLLLYLIVAAVGFLLFMGLQWLVAEITFTTEVDLFQQYYFLCIPLTASLLLFLVMDNYNTALYNASTGVFLREFVLRIVMLGFFMLFIWQIVDFGSYAYLYIGSFTLIALLMMAFIIWRGEFLVKPTPRLWNKTLLKAMAGISFFGLLTGLNNVVILQVNNILIDAYYNEAMTGIYITNFFFAALILLPSRGLNKIAPTIISNAFKSRDLDTVHQVHYKSTINQMVIGLLLFVGLYINLHNVYRILPESYAIGSMVIIYTGMANLVQMLGGISSSIIGFSDYFRYNTYLTVIQLIILVILNLLLLPSWGITGAALATLGAILVINVLKFVFLKIKFDIQPYRIKHLLGLITAAICLGINYFLPELPQLIPDILMRSAIITVIYVSLSYLLKISPEMNHAINKTFEKLRIR